MNLVSCNSGVAGLCLGAVQSPRHRGIDGHWLTKILEAEDLTHDVVQDRIISVIVAAISIAAVVSILITASETLTEIVVLIGPGYVIAVIAVVCVPIGIRVFVAATAPTVVAVGLAGAEAFFISIPHRLA